MRRVALAFALFATTTLAIAAAPRMLPRPVPAQTTIHDYTFPSGAGLLLFYVRPDRTADFEAIARRLGEVLDRADDPVRKQQAANWRVFQSVEVAREHAIYAFIFDPAVAGASYDPVTVLGEALPTEVQVLFDRLKASVIRVERMGLRKLR